MLGETVLQIIVAISPGEVIIAESPDPLFNLSTASAAAGFLLAVCMMFSFRALVRGQLGSYEKTNEGLATQSSEAENLARMIAATQGSAGRRAVERIDGAKETDQVLPERKTASLHLLRSIIRLLA